MASGINYFLEGICESQGHLSFQSSKTIANSKAFSD
jgi:hypothetical protein